MSINYLSGIDLNQTELFKAAIENQPNNTFAGSGVAGQLYFDTTLNVLKVWASGAWTQVGGVTSFTASNGTFISLTPTTTQTGVATLTANLSATGTASASTYLRGDNTWASLPGPATITLTGDVTGSGTTSIATTIASGAVEFSMIDPAAVITSVEGIAGNNNDTTLPTTAAVKSYVDSSLVGSLIFQGGYNAATNTPNLDTPPTGTIKKGFMWTVTADGFFFTEQMRVGDSLIANIDSPTILADWTRVQTNVDLATLSTVGIGNVNAGTGIAVSYSNGTATVSTSTTSFANTGPSTAGTTYSIPAATHGLGNDSSAIMVQLVIVATGETVYADVVRGASGLITITFAASQTANSIRALLQKIG